MTIHILKTVNPFFQDVVDGVKIFELRKNDRDYQLNDRLLLKEYFPENNSFSGRNYELWVTNGIFEKCEGLKDGYVLLAEDSQFGLVKGTYKVGDRERVELSYGGHHDWREITYVLSWKDFPEGLYEGYSIICYKHDSVIV